MKKSLLAILLSVVSFTAIAEGEYTQNMMTPEQAKSQWQSMTPEQQEAAKTYMKTQAQGKQEAWNAMTPEQQQAKKDAAKTTAEPYTNQAKGQMQEHMSGMRAQMQGRMAGRGR